MNQEFIHFDLSPDTRSAAVELLQQQLVDSLDLELQAKQAHWNVHGPHLLSLHELFNHIAETVRKFSELIAERVAQIGGVVQGSAHVIVRDSRLPVYALDVHQAAEHVRAVATALGRFAASVRLARGAAAVVGDASTADLLTQISRAADLLLWKVGAHVCEPRDARTPTSTSLGRNGGKLHHSDRPRSHEGGAK